MDNLVQRVEERAAGGEPRLEQSPASPVPPAPIAPLTAKKVWIDIDNSPHIPLFLPIIEELQKRGVALVLTARDMYQVCDLLEFFHLRCKVIGGHSGKNKASKVVVNCVRAAQLSPTALLHRPNLALSHGSRAQVLVCKLLRIPTLVMMDYEYTTRTGLIEPNWILSPERHT